MSERYGNCHYCRGHGYRWVPVSNEIEESEIMHVIQSNGEAREEKWVKQRLYKKPCGLCDGTGFSADAMGDHA